MLNNKHAERNLYTLDNPKSPVAESFRMLRTNILTSLKSRSGKAILFTSADLNQGTAMIAVNLGIVMAQAGSSVLLVDSNLRYPTIHEFFNVTGNYGLSNLLMQNLKFNAVLQSTGVYGLWYISAGSIPPNPADLVGSQNMANLLVEVVGEYDIVLLNAPPVLGVTDSALLAPLVDGVILVVKAGSTGINAIIDAKAQLEKLQASVIGVVLSEVKMKKELNTG